MIKILKHLKWYEWLYVLAVVGLTVAGVWLDLRIPEQMSELIGLFDVRTNGGVMPTEHEIWIHTGNMLLIVAGSVACGVVSLWFASRAAAGLSRTVRSKLFKKINGFSSSEINKFSIPSLITRSTNDITQVQSVLVMALRMLLYAPCMIVIAASKIIGKNFELSSVVWIAVGILILILGILTALTLPKFSKIQKLNDKLNSVARENLTGIRVIRANGAEEAQEEKFEQVNYDITRINLFVARCMVVLMPVVTLIFGLNNVAIYWLGATLVDAGTIDYNMVVLFASYGIQIIMSFLIVAMLFIMLPRGQISANRIRAVLNTSNTILDGTIDEKKLASIDSPKGKIEFKNVSFKYPNADNYMLKDISFEANAGQTIAFIGSTGSGKSTLINLIPRFFDVTYGEVLVDDMNVKDYTLHALNSKIGYVPQKGVLFSGSIKQNVKFGKEDATDEEVKRALKISQSKFVDKLEGGVEYEIAQGGKNVSGGQRQRLSIARAIIKNPEIYIFDDSFSALDYKTDKALREALKKETKDATKIIVAQRVGSIMDADKIIVLNSGEVVGQGTHKELLKSCEVYKEIAFSQLSKEELENE